MSQTLTRVCSPTVALQSGRGIWQSRYGPAVTGERPGRPGPSGVLQRRVPSKQLYTEYYNIYTLTSTIYTIILYLFIQDITATRGSIPLLHALSDHLERRAAGFLRIKNVFLHARVPVIKAEAYVAPTGIAVDASEDDLAGLSICVDISLDGPSHSGLATTEFTKVALQFLPPLGPVYTILKGYLKAHNLTDAYTGQNYDLVSFVLT